MQLVIDLDARRARMIVYQGRRVRRWGRIALGDESQYDRGNILDRDEVSRRYRRLLQSLQVNKGDVRLLVPGVLAVGDTIDVPRGLPRSKVAPALRSLASKQLGGLDRLFIRWTIVRSQPHVQAFAVGVLRDTVQDHVRVLEGAGLNVRSVELHTLALARLRPMQNGLLIHLGDDSYDSTLVMRGGKPAQAYARAAIEAGDPSLKLSEVLGAVEALQREIGMVPGVVLAGDRADEQDIEFLRSHNVNATLLKGPKWTPKAMPVKGYLPALGGMLA